MCLEISPTNVEALTNIAENWFSHKRPEEAIGYYDRLIEVNKHDGEYYFQRGKCYMMAKDAKSALIDFTKALKLSPGIEVYNEYKRKALM